MTRLFTLEISDNQDQIAARLETQAIIETQIVLPPENNLITLQKYLQLKAPWKVVVPFAKELGTAMARMGAAPRILRDFARLLSLVKATALLRQERRQLDSEGHIIATLEDYETVRELVNEMYIDTSIGAASEVRKLVEAVIRLNNERLQSERITNTTLAKELGTGVKQITRRAGKAIKAGWLVNREQRKSYPADYAPGEPLPETEGLPILTGMTTMDNMVTTESEAKNLTVDMLTPPTVGETPPYTPNNDLGINREQALEIWRQHGAPVIHLGQGVNCLNLEKLLSSGDISQEHLEAVKGWLRDRESRDQ